jgi:hypothetical protein
MDNLDSIIKEVPASSLSTSPAVKNIDYDALIEAISKTLDREKSTMLHTGSVKQGSKNSSSLNLIRDFILNEIEQLTLTKQDDNNNRISNSNIKKSLIQQVNNIISILELSLTNEEQHYYILGMLLKSLKHKK